MKSTKTTIGLFFATLPILYFGGMAYFLWGAPDRVAKATGLPTEMFGADMMKQLGPTVVGLAGFAVLFAFVFVLRVVRASARVSPRPSASIEVEEGEPFDADAALARYLAKKAAGEIDAPVTTAAAPTPPPPAGRGFGRKGA